MCATEQTGAFTLLNDPQPNLPNRHLHVFWRANRVPTLIVDYNRSPSPSCFDADVCVVGAGVAGIAIARTFIGTSVRVCIVESGGLSGEESAQGLYEGTSSGPSVHDLANSRMRAFGGSCNVWGGGCIPLSRFDLTERPWVPLSGWPLAANEIEKYYPRAQTFCRIDSHAFVDGSSSNQPIRPPVAFASGNWINKVFACSAIRAGSTFHRELEQAENITVLLHANLLSLETYEAGHAVREARIGSLAGHTGIVRGDHFVLACGGIENARLLLLSSSVSKRGLGNDRDLVGRFFMDHPAGKIGTFYTDAPNSVTQPYDKSLDKSQEPAFPEICLSDDAQCSHGLLNARVRPIRIEGPIPRGIRALRTLRATLRRKRAENPTMEERLYNSLKLTALPETHLVKSLRGLGKLALDLSIGSVDIARAFARKLARNPAVKSGHVDVLGYFEQAPNPDSRITLGNSIDALGQRKVNVDWRFSPLDWHTFRTASTLFGEELERTWLGRFVIEPWLSEGSEATPQLRGTAHHMGTTRMAQSPSQGVVDLQCRVHGVDNLFIAGSSVFPTSSWAFPTFSIVALSLRLADHIASRIANSHQATPNLSAHMST